MHKKPHPVLWIAIALSTQTGLGQYGPPVGAGEKKEILALLTGPDTPLNQDRLVNMGPRILPILLEVATSEKSSDADREHAFQVVRRMRGVPKGEFVAAAALSLAKSSSVRFSMAAVRLIEDANDSKYAPSVCGFLYRIANNGSNIDIISASRIARALAVVGTHEELKIVEQWRKDNPPPAAGKEFQKRDEQKVQDAMEEVEKLLRAKLKK